MAPGLRTLLLLILAALTLVPNLQSQTELLQERTLSGPDTHKQSLKTSNIFSATSTASVPACSRGVRPDLQYIADNLRNLRSIQPTRLISFDRIRGTADIDFSRLTDTPGLTFHITALWQDGSLLGSYLANAAAPNDNTFQLNSWWFEKHLARNRVIFHLGQFAGEEFYGLQSYASSFILEPLDYAFGNLNVTFEIFDPPSIPAAELRIVPVNHVYVKSMVYAADRFQCAHNFTGLVPQFRRTASTASGIGWTPVSAHPRCTASTR